MTAAALALLVVAVAAFTGLDGVGRGTVLRAAIRPGRDELPGCVGPQLLVGHVWLVAAAGLLLGLFPRWESAVVSAAYGWVLAIVAGLVLRIAALDFRRTGRRRVRDVVAVAGALVTGAGTGGFLATAAGVWPVAGAAAIVTLDLVLGGWWLGRPVPRWLVFGAGALLAVPVVVLLAGGAAAGALVVAALVVAGVLFAVAGPGRVAGGRGRVFGGPGRVAAGPDRVFGGRGRVFGGPGRVRRVWPVLAGTCLVLAAVLPVVARYPELVVPGAGRTASATELLSGPVAAGLVLTGAGPVLLLVLAVQAWFWRGLDRGSPVGPRPGAPEHPRRDAPVDPRGDAPVEPRRDAPVGPRRGAPAGPRPGGPMGPRHGSPMASPVEPGSAGAS